MMANPAKEAKLGSSTTKQPNWVELPIGVTENILHRISAIEILKNARNVCRLWWNICKNNPLMWRTIDMSDCFEVSRYGSYRSLVKICSKAIDLSSGRLEDIRIYHFGTDDLLQYIAYRESNLRCIWLINCPAISDKGLSEVAKKSPLLEELYISGSFLSEDSLEVIGQSCPLLKSLVFSRSSWKSLDDQAFSIAKTMPGLRHLDISGNPLTNVGLLAILDGCPLLESLELRECFHIDLSGSLGKRCHEQIKDLQLQTYYSDPYYCLHGDDCICEVNSENEDSCGHSYGDYI